LAVEIGIFRIDLAVRETDGIERVAQQQFVAAFLYARFFEQFLKHFRQKDNGRTFINAKAIPFDKGQTAAKFRLFLKNGDLMALAGQEKCAHQTANSAPYNGIFHWDPSHAGSGEIGTAFFPYCSKMPFAVIRADSRMVGSPLPGCVPPPTSQQLSSS